MKQLSDKEIQEMIEKGDLDSLPNTDDTKLYQSVYSTLKSEVEYELPTNFAHSVANLVELNSELSDLRTERIWMGIGLFALIVSMLVVIGVLSVYFSFSIASYFPMIVLGSLLILLIQYLDKKVKKLYLS